MLAIIIVNYKNEVKTISFIKEELIKKINIANVIIVVNNAATQETNNKLAKELNGDIINDINKIPSIEKNIYIIPHGDNLGFAKGNNLGAKFSIKHFDIKWFLFSNNDIKLLQNNTVEILINKFNSLPNDIAVLGPSVIGVDNDKQSPIIYLGIIRKWILGLWYIPFLSNKQKIKLDKHDPDNPTDGICYTVMGSFLIIKSLDFIKIDMFDPNTFLFSEEAILAEKLKQINKKIYYDSSVTILHEHNKTIGKFYSSYKKAKLMLESDSYYYSKYRNVNYITILFCRISLELYFFTKRFKNILHKKSIN